MCCWWWCVRFVVVRGGAGVWVLALLWWALSGLGYVKVSLAMLVISHFNTSAASMSDSGSDSVRHCSGSISSSWRTGVVEGGWGPTGGETGPGGRVGGGRPEGRRDRAREWRRSRADDQAGGSGSCVWVPPDPNRGPARKSDGFKLAKHRIWDAGGGIPASRLYSQFAD